MYLYTCACIKVLKNCNNAFAPKIALIFSFLLMIGQFPSQFKCAKIKPIYKGKGSRMDPLNYRPVSNLSTMSKFFEKVIQNNLEIILKNLIIQ